MSKFTIESLDNDHCLINGFLVDNVALHYHYESHTWAAHSPAFIYLRASGCIIALHHDPRLLSDSQFLLRFMESLAVLYNYGFPINLGVFKVSPGKPFALFPPSGYKHLSGRPGIYSTRLVSGVMVDAIEIWEGTDTDD